MIPEYEQLAVMNKQKYGAIMRFKEFLEESMNLEREIVFSRSGTEGKLTIVDSGFFLLPPHMPEFYALVPELCGVEIYPNFEGDAVSINLFFPDVFEPIVKKDK